MITLAQFEIALFTLTRLDMQELVDVGAIADRDYPSWDAFQADRVKWLLLNPAKAPAVWRAIWLHKPATQVAEPAQDNVVDLEQRRGGKR